MKNAIIQPEKLDNNAKSSLNEKKNNHCKSLILRVNLILVPFVQLKEVYFQNQDKNRQPISLLFDKKTMEENTKDPKQYKLKKGSIN
jgi:hypothetical protein